jgi:hypothetical protein
MTLSDLNISTFEIVYLSLSLNRDARVSLTMISTSLIMRMNNVYKRTIEKRTIDLHVVDRLNRNHCHVFSSISRRDHVYD